MLEGVGCRASLVGGLFMPYIMVGVRGLCLRVMPDRGALPEGAGSCGLGVSTVRSQANSEKSKT